MMPSANLCRTILKRLTVWTVIACFSLSLIAPQAAYAQTAFLPMPGTLVHISPGFTPPIITGIQLSPSDPLHINFLIDIGDRADADSDFSVESQKLINYFFAALTVPENEMWVNLSPYEKDKIIADPLSHTAMGRDMLAQDYLLKQLSASMMYPEEELGRKFWRRVHQKALQEFGTTDIPLNTFNKIWIIPQKAQVYVNGPNIFIADSHLKVMLEEDYLALKHHTALQNGDAQQDLVTGVSSAIVREILIPEIEREINTGQNFAPLRQIFHSLILATWYKKNLRDSLLGRVYVNQNKVAGIEIAEQNVREDIYQQYLTALQKGVFDYIREDLDPATSSPIPRRYFSGGVDMAQLSAETLTEGISEKLREAAISRKFHTVETYAGLRETDRDQALLLEKSEFQIFLETAFELARENGEPVRIFVNGVKILEYAASDNIETILPFAKNLAQRKIDQDSTAASFTIFSAENEIYIDTHSVVIGAQSIDSDGAILSEIEERLQVKVGHYSLRPEREENEREAERRAAIEIRQRLGALHGESEAIMALRRNTMTEEQRKFVSQREQQLLADMRRLYREMPVQIVGGKDYSFYSQALTDLKRNREQLSTLIRQADARGDKEKLTRLNQQAIRNNRLLIKTQILVAGLLQTGLSRDGIRHPTPAMNALEGAINSASALEIELEYRIQRLRGRKFRRSLETQDWVGNRVRTFALGTFDIDIEKPRIGQNEPRVTVRQRRPVNVHTRLNRIRLMANRGEIGAAVKQIDYLIGLYQVQYFKTLETYQFITRDLRELRQIVQGLTEGEDLPAGTLKEDIKTRITALTGHIQTPKLMAWDNVRYRSRRKAFEGQIKKIASELSEYMVVLKNKTDLTYYATKLRRAQQRQELGRKVTLSQRDRLMISEKLEELQQWTDRGFVESKVSASFDFTPVLELLEQDAFKRAAMHLQTIIQRLDKRLTDIERITKNLKESAASLFAEMRRDDIKGVAEEMIQLVLSEEFEVALTLLDDLEDQYFKQEHAEPGLIRATSRIWEARGMLRNLPAEAAAKQVVIDQLTETLTKIKEDAQHPSKFRLNITNEQRHERTFYIEPGSSVQGLLNIGRRDPRQTVVYVDGRVIPREEYKSTLLADDSDVELRFDQAMIVIERERLQTAIAAARTFVQELAQRQEDTRQVQVLLNKQTLGRWPLASDENQILTFLEDKLRRENPHNVPGNIFVTTSENRVYITFRPTVTPEIPINRPDFPNDAAMLSLADRAELLSGIFAMKEALPLTDTGTDPQMLVSGEFLNTQGAAVKAVALTLWETDQPGTVNPQRLELIRKVQEYLADQLGVDSLYRIADRDQQPQADTPYQNLFSTTGFSGLYLGIPEEIVGEAELVTTVIREAEDLLETLMASISNNIRLERRRVATQGDQAVLAEAQRAGIEDVRLEDNPLELSTRVVNVLKLNRIVTVKDLAKLSLHELRSMPNLGPAGRTEIVEALAKEGLAPRRVAFARSPSLYKINEIVLEAFANLPGPRNRKITVDINGDPVEYAFSERGIVDHIGHDIYRRIQGSLQDDPEAFTISLDGSQIRVRPDRALLGNEFEMRNLLFEHGVAEPDKFVADLKWLLTTENELARLQDYERDILWKMIVSALKYGAELDILAVKRLGLNMDQLQRALDINPQPGLETGMQSFISRKIKESVEKAVRNLLLNDDQRRLAMAAMIFDGTNIQQIVDILDRDMYDRGPEMSRDGIRAFYNRLTPLVEAQLFRPNIGDSHDTTGLQELRQSSIGLMIEELFALGEESAGLVDRYLLNRNSALLLLLEGDNLAQLSRYLEDQAMLVNLELWRQYRTSDLSRMRPADIIESIDVVIYLSQFFPQRPELRDVDEVSAGLIQWAFDPTASFAEKYVAIVAREGERTPLGYLDRNIAEFLQLPYISADQSILVDAVSILSEDLGVKPEVVARAIGEALDVNAVVDKWNTLARERGIDERLRIRLAEALEVLLQHYGRPYDASRITDGLNSVIYKFRDLLPPSSGADVIISFKEPVDSLTLDYPAGLFKVLFYLIGNAVDWDQVETIIEAETGTQQDGLRNYVLDHKFFFSNSSYADEIIDAGGGFYLHMKTFNSVRAFLNYFRDNTTQRVNIRPGTLLRITTTDDPQNPLLIGFGRLAISDNNVLEGIFSSNGDYFNYRIIKEISAADSAVLADDVRDLDKLAPHSARAYQQTQTGKGLITVSKQRMAAELDILFANIWDGKSDDVKQRALQLYLVSARHTEAQAKTDDPVHFFLHHWYVASDQTIRQMVDYLQTIVRGAPFHFLNSDDPGNPRLITGEDIARQRGLTTNKEFIGLANAYIQLMRARKNVDQKAIVQLAKIIIGLVSVQGDNAVLDTDSRQKNVTTLAELFPRDNATFAELTVPITEQNLKLAKPIVMSVIVEDGVVKVDAGSDAGFAEYAAVIKDEVEFNLNHLEATDAVKARLHEFKVVITTDVTNQKRSDIIYKLPLAENGSPYTTDANINKKVIILHPYFFSEKVDKLRRLLFSHELVTHYAFQITDEQQAMAHTYAYLKDDYSAADLDVTEVVEAEKERTQPQKVFLKDIRYQRSSRSGLEDIPTTEVSTGIKDALLAATQFLEIYAHSAPDFTFDGIAAREELAKNPEMVRAFGEFLAKRMSVQDIEELLKTTDQRWLSIIFDKVLRNIKNSNIFTVLRNDADPVALVIDADGITPDPRIVDYVFVYRPGYFYASTQIVDRPGGTGSLAQGGIRYKVLTQRDSLGRLRPQDEVALDIFESAFAEVDMTSRSKYIRNIVTQTPYSGAKTLMSVYPDSKNIKTPLLKSLARALVDAGVTSRYVIGTESGMTAGDQDTIAQAIGNRYLDHLHYELEQLKTLKSIGEDLSKIKSTSSYGQHLRELQDTHPEQGQFLTDPLMDAMRQRVVASLYLGKQNGGTSLVKLFNSPLKADIQRTLGAAATGRLTDTELNALKEWALGAFSAAMSIEAINEYMPESKLRSKKIGIRGATTGGALALMLTRLGYTVVAIEDINGTVYKEAGFSIAELARLDAIELNHRNVFKWMPEQEGVARHLPKNSLGDKDQVDLDILVSVAPGHRLDDEGVARLRGKEDSDGRDPLVYVEAGFNSINGHERELHRKGILAFKSTSIGFGGAYGSYLEDYIKHRFTSEQLTRFILRVRDASSDAEVVTDSDAKVNDRIVVSDYRSDIPQGEVILENGKVVHSTITDILEGMSVDINDGQLYSQGIALPYRHLGYTRTVIWDNYIVVFNEKGLIRESNHPELQAGHQVTFMDPTQEIRITAYQDIKGIAKRMNTMVMELVRKGLDNGQRQYQITPGQAVRRITKLIDAKKNELDTTDDETITDAIQQIMDKLESDGFYFPQHVARKIAIKRLVSSSDISITLGDEDYVFNAEGYLVEKSDADTDENFYNVRMKEALSGSFDFSLRTAHELEESLRVQEHLTPQYLVTLDKRLGADRSERVETTTGSSIEETLLSAPAPKTRETNPAAQRYLQSQRDQKVNRAGLDAVLPNVLPRRRDILLAASTFLEILSHYEAKRGTGEVFDSIAAIAEMIAHPEIAAAFIDYLYEQTDEEHVLDLIAKTETQWLKILFERSIKNITRTSADVIDPENAEESTGGNREAIAIRLNAARLTGHAEKKEIVFIYLPGRFYAATQLVDLSTAEHTKGGIRYAEPQARANDPKQRSTTEVGFDIMTGAYEDLNNLSVSQYSKNVLAGIGYAGAKTYFGVHQDAVSIKDDNLRSWARAMVDVGLMEVYDGGPDVGMSSANQETIIAGINRRYTRHLMNEVRSLLAHNVDVFNLNLSTYGEALAEIERITGKRFLNDSLIGFMRKRLLVALPKGRENGSLIMEKVFTTKLKNEIGKIIGSAVTGGSAKVGAISHVELAVTGDSTWHSIKAILDYKNLNPSTLKTAVVGAGDVGGSIALKMARQGLKVIAISDINGVVHKPAGFTVAELQNLNNVNPGDRNVLTWMPEQPGVEHLSGPEILDRHKVDVDLLVPAAMGGLINAKSIELLRKAEDDPTREPLMIIEGSNNAFVGMEEELKKRGILAVSGMSVNFGGVKGSTKEAMAKHQLTVRELREIRLRPQSGDPVPTAINTEVTERITVVVDELGKELGTVVVRNGLVVASDMEEITIGSNLDPLNGRLYNRGDDLGYRVGALQRRLAWDNFIVVQDLEGRVSASNHPKIAVGEVFDFLDPLDQIKLELYDEIQQIARRNNTMVMELATKFDMTPTEAVVRLAKALGQRKADIYAATEGSDLVLREAIVKQFKSQGFFMVDHIMRNIAAIQVASQSDLILELIQTTPSSDTPEVATKKTTIRFDANGYIVADKAMTAEQPAEAQPQLSRRQTRSMVVQALIKADTSAEINETFVDALHNLLIGYQGYDPKSLVRQIADLLATAPIELSDGRKRDTFTRALSELSLQKLGPEKRLKAKVLEYVSPGKFSDVQGILRWSNINMPLPAAIEIVASMKEIDMIGEEGVFQRKFDEAMTAEINTEAQPLIYDTQRQTNVDMAMLDDLLRNPDNNIVFIGVSAALIGIVAYRMYRRWQNFRNRDRGRDDQAMTATSRPDIAAPPLNSRLRSKVLTLLGGKMIEGGADVGALDWLTEENIAEATRLYRRDGDFHVRVRFAPLNQVEIYAVEKDQAMTGKEAKHYLDSALPPQLSYDRRHIEKMIAVGGLISIELDMPHPIAEDLDWGDLRATGWNSDVSVDKTERAVFDLIYQKAVTDIGTSTDVHLWISTENFKQALALFNPSREDGGFGIEFFPAEERIRVFSSDQALTVSEAPGGIDFNARNMDLEVQGDRFEFDTPNDMLLELNPTQVQGLQPVIINITPLPNLFLLLGLRDLNDDAIRSAQDALPTPRTDGQHLTRSGERSADPRDHRIRTLASVL